LPLVWAPDPVAEFCLPPGSAQNVLDSYLPNDNIAGQDRARPRLTAVVPFKHAFDTGALPCSSVEVRRPLWIPTGEGFGIAGKMGGQRFGIIAINETDRCSLSVHVTFAYRCLIAKGAYQRGPRIGPTAALLARATASACSIWHASGTHTAPTVLRASSPRGPRLSTLCSCQYSSVTVESAAKGRPAGRQQSHF
jgi:hypothetical protein